MVCPNCGAKMGRAVTCAYCGYENTAAATMQHKKEIASVYERIAALLHMPVERARKATVLLLRGAVILVCAFLIAVAAAFLYSRFAPDAAYKRQQKTLQTLEEYYIAENFEDMNALLEKTDDAYMAVYDKYAIVGYIFEDLVQLETDVPETASFVAGFPEGADLLDHALFKLFDLLLWCRELEADGFVYGEETAVTGFEARILTLLTDTLLLTGAEIESGLEIAATESPDYSDFREIIAQRLTGGNG